MFREEAAAFSIREINEDSLLWFRSTSFAKSFVTTVSIATLVTVTYARQISARSGRSIRRSLPGGLSAGRQDRRDGGSVLRSPAGPVRVFRQSAWQFPLPPRSPSRGKWCELCTPAAERHLRMVLRDMVRQVDDVVVGRFHFRCPPICSCRVFPVAPSPKFIPLRMAFAPMHFFDIENRLLHREKFRFFCLFACNNSTW